MKSHWFHPMPYKYLLDFQRKYKSVWVDVPSELYDPVKGHEIYNEYLDELEFADRVGFDGMMVNEHHNNACGLMPSPNIMLACLARRTQNAAPMRAIPGAQLVTLSKSGHMPMLEEQDAFVQTVTNFLLS